MGSSTYADVVPFVVHGVWYSNDVGGDLGAESAIFEPHLHWDYGGEVVTEISGWRLLSADLEMEDYQKTDVVEYGKRKRILVSTGWKKNGGIVWVVNESEHESVGCADIALAADSREILENFITEVVKNKCPNLTIPAIEESDTVQQTL